MAAVTGGTHPVVGVETVLILVHMVVNIPHRVERAEIMRLVSAERAYSASLQRQGKWVGLWRVVGQWANYSLFEIQGNDELHELLAGLPLYPFMQITVTPLARHPSWLGQQD